MMVAINTIFNIKNVHFICFAKPKNHLCILSRNMLQNFDMSFLTNVCFLNVLLIFGQCLTIFHNIFQYLSIFVNFQYLSIFVNVWYIRPSTALHWALRPKKGSPARQYNWHIIPHFIHSLIRRPTNVIFAYSEIIFAE